MSQTVRVLLVDDEPDFLEAISFWLGSKGYQVNKASTGEAALQLLKEQRHDVVFLDVMMPGMDGIETLRRIRALDKDLPVILVTASSMTDENKYAGAKALGIAGLFPKGSSLTQLSEILQVCLRHIKRHDMAPASAAPSTEGPLAKFRAALSKILKRPPAP
jgi:two-component system response regulator MprA